MEEYIKREAAYHAFYTDGSLIGYEKAYADAYCREIIKNVPPADVAPVRHGRWNRPYISWFLPMKIKNPHSFCTNCAYPTKHKKVTRYCPNCGAMMDGGAD